MKSLKSSMHFAAILGMGILIQSCAKTPTACFTANSKTVLVGDVVTFTNCSENAKSHSWDFGDASTSTDENPTHSFANAGTYIVTLQAMSKEMSGSMSDMSSGKMDDATETITVN